MINRKFKTFILVMFDPKQLTAEELLRSIFERLKYRKTVNDAGLITMHSTGWSSHEILIGSNNGELFADLRLQDNDGIFTWGTRKSKKRLVKEITSIAKEKNCTLTVEMEARYD